MFDTVKRYRQIATNNVRTQNTQPDYVPDYRVAVLKNRIKNMDLLKKNLWIGK